MCKSTSSTLKSTSISKTVKAAFAEHHQVILDNLIIFEFIPSDISEAFAKRREIQNAFLTYLYKISNHIHTLDKSASDYFVPTEILKRFFSNDYIDTLNTLKSDGYITFRSDKTISKNSKSKSTDKSHFVKLKVSKPTTTAKLPIFSKTLDKLINVYKYKFSDELVFKRYNAQCDFRYSEDLVKSKEIFTQIFKTNVPMDQWLIEDSDRTVNMYKKQILDTYNSIIRWNSCERAFKLFYFSVDSFGKRSYSIFTRLNRFTRKYLVHPHVTGTFTTLDLNQSQIMFLANELSSTFDNNRLTDFINDPKRSKLYEGIMKCTSISKDAAKKRLMTYLCGKLHIDLKFFNAFTDERLDVPVAINMLKDPKEFKRLSPAWMYEEFKNSAAIRKSPLAYRLQRLEAALMTELIEMMDKLSEEYYEEFSGGKFNFVLVHDELIFPTAVKKFVCAVLDKLAERHLAFINIAYSTEVMFKPPVVDEVERARLIGCLGQTIKIFPKAYAQSHGLDVEKLLKVIKYNNFSYKDYYHVSQRPKLMMYNHLRGIKRLFNSKSEIVRELEILTREVDELLFNQQKMIKDWTFNPDPDVEYVVRPSAFFNRKKRKKLTDKSAILFLDI